MRPETEAALRAVFIAQRLADGRNGADDITPKGGIDLVTAADLACEDAIRAELGRAFPDYPVIGEERGGAPRPGTPYWLVDPICGTRMYASNIPLYCTNIALVEDGVATIVAIAIGGTGEVLHAETGGGAWRTNDAGAQRLVASDASRTLWIDGKTEQAADAARAALLTGRWYVTMFPSSVAYAHVAGGQMAGILHFADPAATPHGSVHMTAGCLMAAEAGALVTDAFTGRPWSLATRAWMVAATPALQRELTELLGGRS